MSEFEAKSADLREAVSNIAQVGNIPIGQDAAKLHAADGETFGDDNMALGLSGFRDRWKTGLEQLGTDLKAAGGLLGKAADEYDKVDAAVKKALDSKGGK